MKHLYSRFAFFRQAQPARTLLGLAAVSTAAAYLSYNKSPIQMKVFGMFQNMMTPAVSYADESAKDPYTRSRASEPMKNAE